MGLYVNPVGMTKEKWLADNHTKVQIKPPEWKDIPKDEMVVCLVDNGPFTAAAICYKERELNDFADYNDTRKKKWWFVKTELLHEVEPRLISYID